VAGVVGGQLIGMAEQCHISLLARTYCSGSADWHASLKVMAVSVVWLCSDISLTARIAIAALCDAHGAKNRGPADVTGGIFAAILFRRKGVASLNDLCDKIACVDVANKAL
jgi:hypothetical protein